MAQTYAVYRNGRKVGSVTASVKAAIQSILRGGRRAARRNPGKYPGYVGRGTVKRRLPRRRKSRKLKFGSPAWRKKYLGRAANPRKGSYEDYLARRAGYPSDVPQAMSREEWRRLARSRASRRAAVTRESKQKDWRG